MNIGEWKEKIMKLFSVEKNMKLVAVVLAGVVTSSLILGLTGCGKEETSHIDETEPVFVIEENVPEKIGTIVLDYCKYEYSSKTKTAKMIEAKPQVEVLVIPTTIEVEGEKYDVVALQEYVFEKQGILHEVIVPDTVVEVGKGAFKECYNLKRVQLSNGIEILKESTFEGCQKLTELIIPDTVTTIEQAAFRGCVNLLNVNLPNNIEVLEDFLFESCVNLTKITVPSSVKEIGERTFSNCSGLREVNFEGEITKVGNYAFAGCSSLTWIDLPENLKLPQGVFDGSGYGKDYPETVTVNGLVYQYNYNQKKAKLKGVQDETMSNIVIPSQITIDGNLYTVTELTNSFAGTEWLVSIRIPDTITKISDEYFKGCINLEVVELPDSITELGDSVFSGCTSLKEFRFPNGLDTVPKSVLYGCTALETVVLPETVKVIGVSAFENCTNLKNINIPASVVTVLRHSFAGCASLGNITFPENALVEEEVFTTEVVEQADNNWVELTHEELKYIVDYEKGIAHVVGIVLANYMSSDIVIPSELRIDGVTVYVTEIRAEAFRNREDILTVNVSEGITHIHDKAFEKCVSLRSVKLPSSLTEIGDRAFAGCSSLMKVEMPGNPTMGSDVFVDCHETMTMY